MALNKVTFVFVPRVVIEKLLLLVSKCRKGGSYCLNQGMIRGGGTRRDTSTVMIAELARLQQSPHETEKSKGRD